MIFASAYLLALSRDGRRSSFREKRNDFDHHFDFNGGSTEILDFSGKRVAVYPFQTCQLEVEQRRGQVETGLVRSPFTSLQTP